MNHQKTHTLRFIGGSLNNTFREVAKGDMEYVHGVAPLVDETSSVEPQPLTKDDIKSLKVGDELLVVDEAGELQNGMKVTFAHQTPECVELIHIKDSKGHLSGGWFIGRFARVVPPSVKQPLKAHEVAIGDTVEALEDCGVGGVNEVIKGKQYVVDDFNVRGDCLFFKNEQGKRFGGWFTWRFTKVTTPKPSGEVYERKRLVLSDDLGKYEETCMVMQGLKEQEALEKLYSSIESAACARIPKPPQAPPAITTKPLPIKESSLISALGYNESQMLLDVTFKDGETYRYKMVGLADLGKLLTADSLGSAYCTLIRNKFPCVKPDGTEVPPKSQR